MNNGELLGDVTLVRVTVQRGGLAVGSPSGVSHRGLREEGLVEVDRAVGNELSKLSDLANLLEEAERMNEKRVEKRKG